MKKIIILLGILLSLSITASATKTHIPFTLTYGNPGSSNNHRAPLNLTLEAYYDDETNQVEVSGDFYGSVEVYLCDESLDVLDYSTVLNTTLDVPADYHGLIVVRIACDDWVAVGKTEI